MELGVSGRAQPSIQNIKSHFQYQTALAYGNVTVQRKVRKLGISAHCTVTTQHNGILVVQAAALRALGVYLVLSTHDVSDFESQVRTW